MMKRYKQYQQSLPEKKDHDELKRRVDVVNEHWTQLKKVKNKYKNHYETITDQVKKFENGTV